jgi:hypothetical protein
MIAANYRKHPDALALQWPLPLGRPKWTLPRPGARILRQIRADRAAAFKAAGCIRYPEPTPVPGWWTRARQRAKALADAVRAGLLALFS